MRIVVIGAGIVGASAAYHLGRAGADVTLVDRGDVGQATAAGAGIVCPWLSLVDDASYRLASGGAAYYPDLVERLADDGAADVGYKRVGALSLTGSADETAEIAARARVRRADAPQVGEITEMAVGEPATLFPPLARHFAAVHIAGAARVDGALMRDALLHGADRHGVRQVTGTAAIQQRGAVTVDGESIAAETIVVAAGAWSPELIPELSVEPQRGQIVHLRLPGVDTSRWPVVLPTASRHYLLAFDDSRVVVGATREPDAGFDHRVTAAGLREVLDEALSVAPGLADATVAETRIGFRPASQRPLLGRVGDVVVATGFGPTGLTMGPLAGAVAADLALGNAPRLDLSGLSP